MRVLHSLLGVALLLSLSACDNEEATQAPIQTQTPEQTSSTIGRSESLPGSAGDDATGVIEGAEEADEEGQAMPVPQIETHDRAVEEDSPER